MPDLQISARYFRDKLGFRVLWDDATDWRLVERDGVRIPLGPLRPGLGMRAMVVTTVDGHRIVFGQQKP